MDNILGMKNGDSNDSTLDFSSLKKAVESLEQSLDVARLIENDLKKFPLNIFETVRAGVIQTFEVAYELSWKFTQRWLRVNRSSSEADFPRTRKELFRMAARYGLVEDPLRWFEYGEARNESSHTYDENTAREVFQTASNFASDARKLLVKLENLK